MNQEEFTERLSRFKQKERVEVILLIADNPDLTKIAVAWPSIAVHRPKSLSKLEEEAEVQVWKWLWAILCFRMLNWLNRVPFGKTLSDEEWLP